VYDASFLDEDDDGDDGFAEAAQGGFWGWYEGSGSWQSSWQANSKKKKRQQQQQQEEQQQAAAVQEIVAQLHRGTVQMLQKVFGPRLERLNSLEVSGRRCLGWRCPGRLQVSALQRQVYACCGCRRGYRSWCKLPRSWSSCALSASGRTTLMWGGVRARAAAGSDQVQRQAGAGAVQAADGAGKLQHRQVAVHHLQQAAAAGQAGGQAPPPAAVGCGLTSYSQKSCLRS
jgi:hypothetical protein